MSISIMACAQDAKKSDNSKEVKKIDSIKTNEMKNKMQVEIWSDIMCPFCYIGKRKFEQAVAKFENKNEIEVIWHSYQLNPNIKYQPNKDLYDHVAELKGQTREWSVKVHESVIAAAKNIGLEYNFDKAKITNSFDAHRVIQLAKKHNLSNEIEERFFRAYFTEGELMSDHKTLVRLATEVGLKEDAVRNVLNSDQFAEEVKKDGQDAQNLGAGGVPFFVMDKKYAVSGAQDTEVFLETIKKAFQEWRKENPESKLEIINGQVCTPEGDCK